MRKLNRGGSGTAAKTSATVPGLFSVQQCAQSTQLVIVRCKMLQPDFAGLRYQNEWWLKAANERLQINHVWGCPR